MQNNSWRISFTGAQGTGKSTLVDICKELYPEFQNVEYYSGTHEYGIKQNLIEHLTKDFLQVLFLTFHDVNLFKNKGAYIGDRCPLDALVYTKYDYGKGLLLQETFDYIEYKSIQLINNNYDVLFWLRPEFELKAEEKRSDDKQFQVEIDEIFSYYMCSGKIKVDVVQLTGTISERTEQIKQHLCNKK
jgi:energy-coupling factor transporter ATP-binding protein EcfA2